MATNPWYAAAGWHVTSGGHAVLSPVIEVICNFNGFTRTVVTRQELHGLSHEAVLQRLKTAIPTLYRKRTDKMQLHAKFPGRTEWYYISPNAVNFVNLMASATELDVLVWRQKSQRWE